MSHVFFRGSHTESANTPIVEVIPAVGGRIPRVTNVVYSAGSSDHTLTIMRPLGETTITTATQSGTNKLYLDDSVLGQTTAGVDEWLAASDYLVWVNTNGVYEAEAIASLSAGGIMTMSSNLSANVDKGARVWGCYEVARTTHQRAKLPNSVVTTLSGVQIQGGFSVQQGVRTSRTGLGDPIIVYINNVTNAGTLISLSGEYVAKATV